MRLNFIYSSGLYSSDKSADEFVSFNRKPTRSRKLILVFWTVHLVPSNHELWGRLNRTVTVGPQGVSSIV